MIKKVNVEIDGVHYDRMLDISSDWRFSASALGLMRFFKYHDINYATEKPEGIKCEILKEEKGKETTEVEFDFSDETDDILYYNFSDCDLSEDDSRYLDFAEHYFESGMHHKNIEYLLKREITDELKKEVNEKLKANSILKKTFGKIKYDGENTATIEKIIEENKESLIRETYRGAKSMYANFCNTNILGKEKQEICRLVGYNIDLGKKKKSLGFNWDYSTYVYSDEQEFDYIPFAFNRTRDVFFINNNYDCERLKKSNDHLSNEIKNQIDNSEGNINENKLARRVLFLSQSKTSEFEGNNVELISKIRENDFFETIHLRGECSEVLKKISEDENIIKALESVCRYAKNDTYIDVMKYVIDHIINKVALDNLIDKLISDRSEIHHEFLISQLIKINILIYRTMEDENMRSEKVNNYLMLNTAKVAEEIVRKIDKNKVNAYRNQLVSSLNFKDYDRYCEVLLQLASYSNTGMDFANKLFDDFNKNKNYAYAFVNNLIIASNGGFNKSENK